MKKFLDYNGLTKYTSLLNTNFAKLENGAVSEDVLPMSAKDVVEFDGFCDASVIIESQTPLVGAYKVQYFVKGKRFIASKENVLGYYSNFLTSDLYQKTDGDSKQPYNNKIYVDVSSENSSLYRWNGTDLIKISDTSKLEWASITDKPALVTNVSYPTYDDKGLHFSVSYTQAPSKLIVIPEASSDSSGIITSDMYTFLGVLKQSNVAAWSEFVSRYGVVDASNIKTATTDLSITLNIPYDTASDSPKSNNKAITFYGADTNHAGLMTARDKDLFKTYIDDEHNKILYYRPTYAADKVILGHTTIYEPDTQPGVAGGRPALEQSTIAAATSTTAGVMTSDDKKKLDAVYKRSTFILIDEYVETGELLQASIELNPGRRPTVVYLANENALAVKKNNAYYSNWTTAFQYGELDSRGNWIPKDDTFYISTQNFSMYIYHNSKLNKIN